MDAVEVNLNWVCRKMESAERSLSAEAPGLSDACRDPELFPRVGDQFQVQIPPTPTEYSHHYFTKTPGYAFGSLSTPHEFSIGLPISLTWIREDSNKIIHDPQEVPGSFISMSNRNEPVQSDTARKMKVFPESNLETKVEPMNITVDNGIQLWNSERLIEIIQHCEGEGYCMVPGSVSDAWSELEKASFVFGLYIFGKNLVQVKKFVESKTMGDVLSHYYGDFYRSDKYIRWSDCRKMKSKRCVYGQRIFTGARQQELLSRLLPHLSEECQNTLAKVAKAFGEGKILLNEYVFKLKAMVGLSALVEAVGIGKGKQDLTSFTSETPRSVQVAPTRREIPVGKACSSLTPLEIIGFLTGGYRLSKTKSNDLFWEAVWPRLLARGWHSEQPNDNVRKQSLVFLIPGVKKFSRLKLVKGDHYFDSVSDVLSKVAVNPELLEFDTGEGKEDCELTKETGLDQGNFSHKQRRCYLKPPNPSCNTDIIKFTIVDTSLAGRRTNNVRKLKSLPVDVMNFSTCRSDSDESDKDSSNVSMDESECGNDLSHAVNNTNILESKGSNFSMRISCGKENSNNAAANHCHTNGVGFIGVPMNSHENQKSNNSPDLQQTKTVKNNAKQRKRPADGNSVAKRQLRETAYDSVEKSFSENDVTVIPTKRQNEVGCASDNSDFKDDILTRPPHGKQPRACRGPFFLDSSWERSSSTSSSSRDSPNVSDEYTLGSKFSGVHPNERTQSRILIDLNIPAPEDADIEPFSMEMTERHHDESRMQPEDRNIHKNFISALDSSSMKPPDVNSCRRSTRNRPPTAKALEALACGYLSITSRRKNEDDFPFQKSRSLRRACGRLQTSENCSSSSFDDSKGDETGNAVSKSNVDNDTLNELLESSVTHEEKEPPFLDLKLG